MKIGKYVLGCAAAIAVILAILCFVVPIFVPWSPLNCRYEEVDINSGRLRFTRYLLYCRVSERCDRHVILAAVRGLIGGVTSLLVTLR